MNRFSQASPGQIRRWSDEVARDPSSLAVFDLAGAYLSEGRREAAERLCVRGLVNHPEHVDAHVLLGRIYRAGGAVEKAFDEWDIALRLDPDQLTARREIALVCADRGQWSEARRHLEHAVQIAPEDADLRRTIEAIQARMTSPSDAGETIEPRATEGEPEDVSNPDAFARHVDDLILGAILIDEDGFVVAGHLGNDDQKEEIAAALAGATDDVERAVRHLELGEWETVMLESSTAVVHLTPVKDAILAVAGHADTPIGWLVRASTRLRDDAVGLLGGQAGAEDSRP